MSENWREDLRAAASITVQWEKMKKHLKNIASMRVIETRTSLSVASMIVQIWRSVASTNPICYFFSVFSPHTIRLLLELFRCNSFLSFVTSFFSFQLFIFRSAIPFVSTFLAFFSLNVIGWINPDWHAHSKQLLATTCHHLLPLPATCSTCGHLLQQAPAVTCGGTWTLGGALVKLS